MNEEMRRERRIKLREVISDAKHLTEKEFPYVTEETNEYRITVLSIANMLLDISKNQ